MRLLRIERAAREVVAAEHVLLELLDVARLVEVVHFLAEASNRVAVIALFIGVVDRRQHDFERRIRIEILLKARNLRDEMLHLRHVFGGREEEENRVEVALFRHDRVFAQEVRENRRRHAEFRIVARVRVDPRRREQELARIDEVLEAAVAAEFVPLRLRIKFEEAQVVRDLFGRIVAPGLAVDQVRDKRTDVLAGAHEELARFNADRDAVRPEALAASAFVHLRVHVERRKERIEGRG